MGDPFSFSDCAAYGAGTMGPAAHTISDVGSAKKPTIGKEFVKFVQPRTHGRATMGRRRRVASPAPRQRRDRGQQHGGARYEYGARAGQQDGHCPDEVTRKKETHERGRTRG